MAVRHIRAHTDARAALELTLLRVHAKVHARARAHTHIAVGHSIGDAKSQSRLEQVVSGLEGW